MEKRTIKSTSLTSAKCSDLELRRTEKTRLIFRPELVENPNDPAAAVRGTLMFQAKGRNEEWVDSSAIKLNSLKSGEGVRLELHSGEVLQLFQNLRELYELHRAEGIPLGETQLVRADSTLVQVMKLPRDQLHKILHANRQLGNSLLASVLAWAIEASDLDQLVPVLASLGSAALRGLSAAASLSTLKQALQIWQTDKENGAEEYWQQMLAAHSFVLEQVFSWPATIVKDKAYVGGKSINNAGGSIVDFLTKNDITANAALVEIKTPVTPLLGRRYRNGVYIPSDDLTGSVMQVLNYKHTLLGDAHALLGARADSLRAIEPRCVVIAGSTSQFGDCDDKVKSFELFRAQLTGVSVIAFDELFGKVQRLVDLIESGSRRQCAVDP